MREIEMADRPQMDRLRQMDGHCLASHAFPSLFLWSRPLGLRLMLERDVFAVRAGKQEENTWFFPCGSEAGKKAFLAGQLAAPHLRLLYLRKEDVDWLNRRFPGQWRCKRCPDADEYLYRRDSHLAMEGGPFRHLRWRVRKIRREMAPAVRALNQTSAADARRIVEQWAACHPEQPGAGPDDRAVALAALEQGQELGMQGVVVYLEGQPAAFMAGFPLSADTFDAAVGKCARNVQGLTYFTLQELMRSVPEHFQWWNLEEDLGLPGLRQMKEQYLPDGKQEIWEAERI